MPNTYQVPRVNRQDVSLTPRAGLAFAFKRVASPRLRLSFLSSGSRPTSLPPARFKHEYRQANSGDPHLIPAARKPVSGSAPH